MELLTKVVLPNFPFKITHKDKILLLGSCFATNIGDKLSSTKFDIVTNPFGILYNPISIQKSLMRLLSEKVYSEKDLFNTNGSYRSFDHHSIFSDIEASSCLKKINCSFDRGVKQLKACSLLIITFGTSFVYSLRKNGYIVSNCHKLPEDLFIRKRIDIVEIISQWTSLILSLKKKNPNIRILFTVSPIRHWKDGAHENQLSKATLLLAIDRLSQTIDNVFYFPSYEIVMDELRDYRFYKDDMLHPSSVAIDYIWDRFKSSLIDISAQEAIESWIPIQKALDHKPFSPNSQAYKDFLFQTLLKAEAYQKKFPYFDIDNEIQWLRNRISELSVL